MVGVALFRGAHDDTLAVHLLDDAGAARGDGGAGIARDRAFHAGADERRIRPQQRHRLALHVRAHQRAVGVIVLEERDQRRGDRNDLLRRHVDEIDFVARDELRFAVLAGLHEIFGEIALGVDLRVGLRDLVLGLFHRREIDDLVRRLAVRHLAVRAFDEAVLVDARVRRQRVDQTDVRAFRRFDRADAAIVRRVHVADFEARALTRQTARAERRETALVRDLGQRVGLVHELRQLRGAEEFAHRGRRRLRVDQVVRHHGVDIDRRHAFLDRALHAQQADAILIFHQLADRAHAAVAEIVDVVDFAAAVAQIDQRAQHFDDVFQAQHAHGVVRIEAEAHVHLHAADGREIIALAIEEQAVEQRFGGVERRRLAGTHDAVDVEQRLFAVLVLVELQRVADVRADRSPDRCRASADRRCRRRSASRARSSVSASPASA